MAATIRVSEQFRRLQNNRRQQMRRRIQLTEFITIQEINKSRPWKHGIDPVIRIIG